MNLPVLLVQHRAGAGDRDRVRRLAGAAAVAARPRPRGAGQHPTRDRQRAGPADPSRHGRGPGRADAPDADRGWRGGEGVPAAGERRPRIRPARTPCRCRSPSTTVPTRRGRSVPSISSGSARPSPRCRRWCRPGSRPTPRRRRTAATARSRFAAADALEKPVARSNFISPEYFPLLRIPVAQGRLWNGDEIKRGAALAVINQTMARQYWPNGDAIGRQFRFANHEGRAAVFARGRPAPTDGSRSSASSPTRATTACATRSSPPSTCRIR